MHCMVDQTATAVVARKLTGANGTTIRHATASLVRRMRVQEEALDTTPRQLADELSFADRA